MMQPQAAPAGLPPLPTQGATDQQPSMGPPADQKPLSVRPRKTQKDVSRQVVEMAAAMVQDILASVKEQVFAGPYSVVMDNKSALENLQAMSPQEKWQKANALGMDEYIRQVQELLHGKSSLQPAGGS